MDAYTDTRMILVKQIQAERCAEAAANRLTAHGTPRRAQAPADGLCLNTARLLVAIVLVVLGVCGIAGTGALLAGPAPMDGPTPGYAR
jgi:hypothetical protein